MSNESDTRAQAGDPLLDRADRGIAVCRDQERRALRRRRGGRRRDPRIVDIATHPRAHVGLRVAADYLGLDERTVRARIEDGRLTAVHDGRVYQILLVELQRYDDERRRAS